MTSTYIAPPPSCHAAMRADALLDQDDMDGRAVWIRIIASIKDLEAKEPEGAVHR